MTAIIHWLESVFAAIPLTLLEVWGRCAYLVGFAAAVWAYGGFTCRVGTRLGLGRERQAWDAKGLLAIPVTFLAVTASGYLGSFIVLVPGAQTFESLKDLVVFLCIVLFGYPALLAVPFAYGLSDLIEGVPPGFLLDWLPGYFINPTCFWIAYQLIGKEPDFLRWRTWGRYAVFVALFMFLEPVLWGYICAEQFTSAISYRSITPALFFTTAITWLLAPPAMLAAYPLARRTGMFWAGIAGHVKERALRSRAWSWEAGPSGEARGERAEGLRLPLRMLILTPFVGLVLVMVGATAFVTLRSAEAEARHLALRVQDAAASNLALRLDGLLGSARAADAAERTKDLAALLGSLPIAHDGRAVVLDRAGGIVAATHGGDDPITARLVAGVQALPGGPAAVAEPVGFDFFHLTAKPLARETWLARASRYREPAGDRPDWIIVTALPESFHLAGVWLGNSRSAMVFSVALLLALAVAAVIASAVAAPIQRIAAATRAVAAGDLKLRLPASRLEELDGLTQSFNRMAHQLKSSFDALLAEVAARKAREKELESSEARVRTSEHRLQLATHAAHLGVWDWDVVNDQLLWDDSMYLLYGVRREEFSGAYEAWTRCIVPEDLMRAANDVEAALRGEREFTPEFRVRWRDGSVRVIRGAAQTIRDAAGKPVRMVGVNWDVTEQLRAEQELRQHRAHLEELVAERTAALSVAVGQAETASRAKSTFLANMSHEIRTPLNAILGFSQLLLRDPELTPAQRDHLRVIDRNGAHLLTLITDILEMSKIEANRVTVNPVAFAPALLARDLDSMFRARAESKGLSFFLELDPALPERAVADEGKLRQILVNLLGNAVKFTPAGRVLLRFAIKRQDDTGWWLRCEVSDTGPGIADEDRPRLFQNFEQTAVGRRSGSGTGLGLAISREFARMMDGDIVFESEPGHGTLFRVDLPLRRPTDESGPTAAAAPRRVRALAADQPPCRVLVVDDQADNRRLVRELLGSAGFAISEAGDGLEALEAFGREAPHCILMDLRMPVLDGIEAIRRLRETPAGRAVKILALSASVFIENRDDTIAVGADDFLGKPFREPELFERIRRLTGVTYDYAEPAADDAARPAEAPAAPPTAGLPPSLALRLRHALEEADLDRVVALAEEIAAHDPALAARVRTHAAQFDYERLRHLLSPHFPSPA